MGSDSTKKAGLGSQDDQVRRYTNKIIVLNILTLSCVGYFCSKFLPKSPDHDTIIKRLVFALKWQAVSVFSLVVGVFWVMTVRYSTPAINPLAEHGKKYSEVAVRYVTNTTEEYILHVIGCLALSTHLTPDTIMILPVLSALFLIGRLLFAVGYTIGPDYRLYGFTITYYPSALAILCSIYFLFKETFV